jgi:hypothetical protein
MDMRILVTSFLRDPARAKPSVCGMTPPVPNPFLVREPLVS